MFIYAFYMNGSTVIDFKVHTEEHFLSFNGLAYNSYSDYVCAEPLEEVLETPDLELALKYAQEQGSEVVAMMLKEIESNLKP